MKSMTTDPPPPPPPSLTLLPSSPLPRSLGGIMRRRSHNQSLQLYSSTFWRSEVRVVSGTLSFGNAEQLKLLTRGHLIRALRPSERP
ncbi:hypothetical protein INR49_000122 [Caranx melampygus]|nr:hypothetical protein INR49_000122 [Caranx melampygus]